LKKHLFFTSRIGVILPAGAILGLALTGCSLPFGNSDDESYLNQGMTAIKEGRYSEASQLFDSAVSEDEDERQALRGKGMAAMAEGDYTAAQNHLKEALACSNGIIKDIDIDIAYYLAVAEYKSGDVQGAIDTYDSIINIKPGEDNAYYMRGKAYLGQGEKEKALSDYEQAVTLAPQDYDHYVRICSDLREAGYENEGDEYLRRAMESGNKLSDYQLGVFNYYLGNYTDARNYLETARDSKKQDENLIMYLGRTYEELGDIGYAISLYENYIAGGGADAAQAYLRIGLAKMNQKDYSGAVEAFDSGISSGGGSAMQSLQYNKVIAYEMQYDFATAKSLMAEYVQKYPGDEKAARENIFLSTR